MAEVLIRFWQCFWRTCCLEMHAGLFTLPKNKGKGILP